MSNGDYYTMRVFQQRHHELLAAAHQQRLARELDRGPGWLSRLITKLVGGRGERPPRRRPVGA